MDKKKVLHALRSLEMTLEQKQELIEALAEGNSNGGGSNAKKVIIDLTPVKGGNGAQMNITQEQLDAFLNDNCKFIVIDEEVNDHIIRPHIVYMVSISKSEGLEDNIIYVATKNGNDNFEFEIYQRELLIATPLIG